MKKLIDLLDNGQLADPVLVPENLVILDGGD